MSRFSRAYEAAIQTAGLTRAQAAATAGMDASVISRILNDDRPATPEHVVAMLRAIEDASDREYCVREFLTDQCPEDLRERLVLHFGAVHESKATGSDSLSRNLQVIEAAAVDNPDLRKLLENLAAMFGE